MTATTIRSMTTPVINVKSLLRDHWSERERGNAEAVLGFVQRLMNEHDFEQLRSLYAERDYRQHNRNIPDGIEGVLKAIAELVKLAPEFAYDVKHVYVDGDHVILHAHATMKAAHRGDESQGMNIIDVWKVSEGFLVEHWDAVQGLGLAMRMYGLFTGGKVRNDNGVF